MIKYKGLEEISLTKQNDKLKHGIEIQCNGKMVPRLSSSALKNEIQVSRLSRRSTGVPLLLRWSSINYLGLLLLLLVCVSYIGTFQLLSIRRLIVVEPSKDESVVTHSMGTISTTLNKTRSQVVKDLLASNKIDYQGVGHVQLAYRLGDVFDLWYLHQYNMTFDELVRMYRGLFPGTLAHEYLLQVGSPEYAHRNLTALLQVIARREKVVSQREELPKFTDFIIHLRLGDVLTSDCCTDLNKTIKELWYNPQGFVNHDCYIKHNYNLAEFEQLIRRLPSTQQSANKKFFKNCIIVGAGFVTEQDHSHRDQQYQDLVAQFLQRRLGCEIQYYRNPDPDEALLYMAAARWILVAMGGYSQIAAACVRARGGMVLHDKFNGNIAGWNSDWFTTSYQRHVYANDYIDWNRVFLS